MSEQVDTYLTQQILTRLAKPFRQWQAFRLGIIDAKGKTLKHKTNLRTQQERDAWGYFDIICANLKKLLNKYPTTMIPFRQLRNNLPNAPIPTVVGGPQTIPLGMLAGTFFLMKDHVEDPDDLEALQEGLERWMKKIQEDAAANSAGGGGIAGIGVGPQGEPPMRKKKRASFIGFLKRKRI